MGRNKVSDDIDHVPIDPKPRAPAKKPPPEPWKLPKFKPTQITNPLEHGQGNLPPNVNPQDPLQIFSLFFNQQILQTLANHTNEYAALYPPPASEGSRGWRDINPEELRAYTGVWIYMGIHAEPSVGDYWNTDIRKPSHYAVRQAIGLRRWEQIDRFFHISKPLPPDDTTDQSPFKKLEPLNEELRSAFKEYWKIGTHLAVDETIQRFMGRTKETVNIPNKPEPEGFKIWCLANQGYVLDWLYHAKGDKNGPVDLDDYWTIDRGFPKTQAVVLDLLAQDGISKGFHHIVWLDNLFTSINLLSALIDEGLRAAGTVRTTKTRREVLDEEALATKKRSKNKPPPEQMAHSLMDLKLTYNT